jgi:hypothetical protein
VVAAAPIAPEIYRNAVQAHARRVVCVGVPGTSVTGDHLFSYPPDIRSHIPVSRSERQETTLATYLQVGGVPNTGALGWRRRSLVPYLRPETN